MPNLFDTIFDQTQEEQKPILLESEGNIPDWVTGSLFRNGPGCFKSSTEKYKHWFDGLAIIHKFSISEGRVTYASKYLETNVKKALLDDDKITFPEFATDPCFSIFKKLQTAFISANPKVNILRVDNRVVALGETKIQVEIDEENLETLGVHTYYSSKLTPSMTTAHPHVEGKDLYNMLLKMGPLNFYEIMKYNIDTKQTSSVCKIPVKNPSYVHSIGMSENYIILAHYPYQCNSIDFIIKKKPFIENFNWNDKKKSQIKVIDKRKGKVIHSFDTDPFFAFHFINAYEERDKLIFDMATYDDAKIIDDFYLNNLSDVSSGLASSKISRFTIDLKQSKLDQSIISNTNIELPTIDSRFNKKSHDHIYGVSFSDNEDCQFYDQVVKINTTTGACQFWKEADYFPGEPIFIPKPDSTEDDEGVVLSIAVNVRDATKGSKLVFLDAKSFEEIGSCSINHSITPGFHGNFLN